MSGIMGLGKRSSLVSTLSMHHSLLWGGLLEGEWGSPGWWLDQTIIGSQDFVSGAKTRVSLSRDFADGCHMWDPWGCTYVMLVRFFPCRVHIDSNHHDTLRYEWPLAHCCHLVVCLVVLIYVLEDDNGYDYHDFYCIYFNYLDDACFMHVIVYRCKHNLWLN
jgi:hypothetical protein